MGGEVDPVTYDITLPKTAFLNYFTYKADTNREVANYFYDNLGDLVLGIMRMCGVDETLEEMIASIKHGYLIDVPLSGMEDPKNWGIQCVALIGKEIILKMLNLN